MKITRLAPLVLVAAAVMGGLLPITLASASAPSARAQWVDSTLMVATEPDVRAYLIGGNIRPNSPNASAGWHIIEDGNHDAPGLLTVKCLSNGMLQVSYPTTVRVGILQAEADEEWVGRFHAGGSQGFSATNFKITNSSGTKVPCNSKSLTSSGNWTLIGVMFY
jgi:hypothetical protein